MRVLAYLIWLVAAPLVGFAWLCDELSGFGRWYRAQCRRMESDRPPLDDADYLARLAVPADDAAEWLAVRAVTARLCGLPATAIQPEDDLDLLLRLMSPWYDLLGVVFDLEERLGVKLSVRRIDRELTARRHGGRRLVFADLATALVAAVAAGRERIVE